MFRRYAIVSSADQRAAAEMLERARSLAPVQPPRPKRKTCKCNKRLVAGACNNPNCLVLPFRLELIRPAA
jgi:hypothetical protein